MTALGSGKIWILVPDWSRLKSSEPEAGDVTCKIRPLYFTTSTCISKDFFFRNVFLVKYRGPILRVTSPALGSDDLSLDQSETSIQILPEPNAVTSHVFFIKLQLYHHNPSWILMILNNEY